MNSQNYTVIGVMSGTSKDGIDLAYIRFVLENQSWTYQFLETATRSYTKAWKKRLEEADQLPKTEIEGLNIEYTSYLGKEIKSFIEQHKITDLDAVCSHGHTVFHQPEIKYTLQIGNLPQLADVLGVNVICDFRTADVQLGGQGAPLVPIGDQLLFSNYEACLNLGGFANISMDQNGIRSAYDICAVNTVLNHYATILGKAYDDKGKIAKAGKPDPKLSNALQSLPFYKENPPKSLGIEWVKEKVLPLIDRFNLTTERVLATYTRHIRKELAAHLPQDKNAKVLVTGGGAYNDFLINGIQKSARCKVVIPDSELVDYKEALIFGLLGVLRLRNEINVLRSVTGAPEDHCAGVVFEPSS